MNTYKKALDEHVVFNGYDYLTPEDIKELRRDVKQRDGVMLSNSNGRATIRTNKNGDIILTSYYTDVAIISGGRFYKTWHGYSATTLKHVNEFRRVYGLPPMSKKDWILTETI